MSIDRAFGPNVLRLIAPNPGPMTAEGTNAYLVGGERLALIDPGPDNPEWRARLTGALKGRELAAIVVTHSHRDHSAGAPALARETGAPIYAFGPHGAGQSAVMARLTASEDGGIGGGEGADHAFAPDHLLADGAALAEADPAAPGGGWRLTALHTPGHLGNHLCLALEWADGAPSNFLFSGDHVMGWATSLISPPDGDMGAFMRSLERLRGREETLYLPGHGAEIETPQARVEELYAHRRNRERQITAALADCPADAASLVATLYADIDPRLHGMAARNVLAHLVDLWERGEAAPLETFSAEARFALSG